MTLSGIIISTSALAQIAPVDTTDEFIIADEDMANVLTMSKQDVQHFLESQGSYLANYQVVTPDTSEMILASEMIHRAALANSINPQFLIVLIQKEQGVIENPKPDQRDLDFAAGYGCFDNQPCNERWRGFAKQVNSAAIQFRYYLDNIGEYYYQAGKLSIVDGQNITPRTAATASLYNYTPHLHGNRLFTTLWKRYFTQNYPDGTLVQVPDEKTVWLIQNGIRRGFTTKLALVSRYNPKYVVPIKKTDLEQFPRGNDIQFAAYSLVQAKISRQQYLLTLDAKRLIPTKEIFRKLGFNPEEVDLIADEQLDTIPTGEPLSISDSYPTGSLLQDKKSRAIYYVEAGRKYPLIAPEIAKTNYSSLKPLIVTQDVLDRYTTGLPILYKDGTILKGSGPDVFVISNQQRRRIASEVAFNAIGYKWSNIIVTKDEILTQYPLGPEINVD